MRISRFLIVVLCVLLGGVDRPLVAQKTVKNPDGTTTITTKSEEGEPGTTKDTTRNEKGDVVKEEFKDDKGRTVQVKYKTVQGNGNLRIDEVKYDPATGQPKSTKTTITDVTTGVTITEAFNYKESVIFNGLKSVSDAQGGQQHYKFDPVSGEWSSLDTSNLDPFWWAKFYFGYEDAFDPMPPGSWEEWDFFKDVFGKVGCCEDEVQGLALTIETTIRIPAPPTLMIAAAQLDWGAIRIERPTWNRSSSTRSGRRLRTGT